MSIHTYFNKLDKTKRVLSLISLVLFAFILAIVLAISGLYFYGKKNIIENPAKAIKESRAICNFTVPEGYKITLLAAFSSYKCASMYDSKNMNSIVLTLFPPESGMGVDQVAASSKQMLTSSSKIKYVEAGKKTVIIRGETVGLFILEGVNKENRRRRDWVGAFKGDNGTVALSIGGWEENWDELTFTKFIQSIH